MTTNIPLQTWKIETHEPLGHCAYCSSTTVLTDEHIIPFGLLPKGGDWFLPDSSCRACQKITTRFEGSVQQRMLGPLRHKMRLAAKSKRRGRKDVHDVTYNYPDGRLETKELPLEQMPTMCIGFDWPHPRLFRNLPPSDQVEGNLVLKYSESDLKGHLSGRALKVGRVYPLDFARMLAKIAHVYAIAKYGPSSFDPLLPPLILDTDGKAGDLMTTLVGGDETSPRPLPPQPVLHHLIINGVKTV